MVVHKDPLLISQINVILLQLVTLYVDELLLQLKKQWLHHVTHLDMPNITVKSCAVLNPAILFPTPADGEPYDCVAYINHFSHPELISLISGLLDTVLLPVSIYVMNCYAHTLQV